MQSKAKEKPGRGVQRTNLQKLWNRCLFDGRITKKYEKR
jgi:hypothetical protein